MKSLRLAVLLVPAFLAVCTFVPLRAKADAISDSVGSLEASVQDVRITGTWQIEGRKGVYRILIARPSVAKPTARLFVQWIATGADGSQTIDRTIEVTELPALKLDIADYVAETDTDGLSVFVETTNPANDSDQSYELILDNDGTYRFGPASN
jgi:hypothetical protein